MGTVSKEGLPRVLVALSGRGSNFEALHKQASKFSICAVVSNKHHAGGLTYAQEHNIPTKVIARKDFPSKVSQQQALLEYVNKMNPDLVVLAGFMQILTPEFVSSWSGKLVNIHPSLLPEFPGLDTHARAIESGNAEHGCTVHLVDAGVDTGPILTQAKCPIEKDDSPEVLAARVLTLEHSLYTWTVEKFLENEITYTPPRSINFSLELLAEAEARGFLLGTQEQD